MVIYRIKFEFIFHLGSVIEVETLIKNKTNVDTKTISGKWYCRYANKD